MLTQTKRKISFEISPRALLRALIGWFVKLRHLADFGTIKLGQGNSSVSSRL